MGGLRVPTSLLVSWIFFNKCSIFHIKWPNTSRQICILDTQLLNPLEFPVRRVLEVSFVMWMKLILRFRLRMGLGCQRNQPGIEGWNFQSHPLIFREEVEWITSGPWLNQSCWCNKVSIKIQKGIWRASRLGNQNTYVCHSKDHSKDSGTDPYKSHVSLVCWCPTKLLAAPSRTGRDQQYIIALAAQDVGIYRTLDRTPLVWDLVPYLFIWLLMYTV